MSTTTGAPVADWYPDPLGAAPRLRYWDGLRWTGWVATDGVVSQAPMREPRLVATGPIPGIAAGINPEDHRMVLPPAAIGITIASVVWSIALTIGAAVVAVLLGLDTDAELMVASALGLYSGLVLGCVVVQRRYGTRGRFRRDFGFEYGQGDWWRGLLASLAARGGGMVLAFMLVIVLGDHLGDEKIDQLGTSGEGDPTATFLIVFAIVAVIVAPLVEELFFRGLLLRSLTGVVPEWAAILIQGVLFGLAHISFGAGLVNALVVVPIGFAGLAFGWLAQRYKRLGPGILGHAWFNVVAVAITLIVLAVD